MQLTILGWGLALAALFAVWRYYSGYKKQQRKVSALEETKRLQETALLSLTQQQTQHERTLKSTQQMLNSIPWAVWQRDRDLTLSACNQAYANAVGETMAHALDHNTELHKESRNIAERAVASDATVTEQLYVIVNGSRYLYEITEIPMGTGEGTIGFARDLSRYEAIRTELRNLASMQDDLLESTRSAVAIFTADKQLRFYNRAYTKLWDLDPVWLDAKPTYGEILETLREKRLLPEQVDFKSFKKDQLHLFIEVTEKHEEVYYLPNGRALRVIVIPHSSGGLLFSYEDMTEQLALERSYNTLVSVQKYTLDNLSEGIAVFRQDGKLEFFNPVFAKLWHLEVAFLNMNPHISDILERTRGYYEPMGDWEMYKRSVIGIIHKRSSISERIERSDGIVLGLGSIPLPDGATLLTYTDVTDSYRLELSLRAEKDALEEADRIKNRFLSNVSYELRSPLTSIRGYGELLQQQYAGDLNEKQRDYVKEVLHASQRLQQVIDNVLDVAALDAGYIALYKSRFALHPVLETVVDEAKRSIGARAITCRLVERGDTETMYADENAVYRILTSLVENAIRAVGGEGVITLRVEKTDVGNLVFHVEDNGHGIDTVDLPHIFDKFFKLQHDSSSGTGLGLTVCKALIERHGGSIHVESVLGKGTHFTIIFPQQ